MTTAKLLGFGALLLMVAAGLPAAAEEAQAPESAPAAESAMPAAADAAADADVAQPTAPAEPVAEPWAAEQVDAEAEGEPETQAVAAVPASLAEPSAPAPALGPVGYDSKGRQGRIHTVVSGDTLWDVSDAYLGTPWVWPTIWQDNQEIENPHLIFPGDRIWITPWEMRKISAAEADALLAGQPAAFGDDEPEMEISEPDPVPVVAPERTFVRVADRERVGLLSEGEVDASASVLSNTAPRLMISHSDRVWLGLGEGDAKRGDQFTIYRVEDTVYDPESGRRLGYHVNFLGWAEIVEVHEEASLAVVRESHQEIEVGDKLMPRAEPRVEIAVRPAPDHLQGQISFLPNNRTHMGSMDYVYLNRGTLDGLDVGSSLDVYRAGFEAFDRVLDADVQVPDRVVAGLLVVRAEEEASVALVQYTQEELALGDSFRGSE